MNATITRKLNVLFRTLHQMDSREAELLESALFRSPDAPGLTRPSTPDASPSRKKYGMIEADSDLITEYTSSRGIDDLIGWLQSTIHRRKNGAPREAVQETIEALTKMANSQKNRSAQTAQEPLNLIDGRRLVEQTNSQIKLTCLGDARDEPAEDGSYGEIYSLEIHDPTNGSVIGYSYFRVGREGLLNALHDGVGAFTEIL